MAVIAKFKWGTHVLVVAGGKAIRGKGYGFAGQQWGNWASGCLKTSGNKYKPCCCSCKVLIRQKTAAYSNEPKNRLKVPEEGAWFSTLDDTKWSTGTRGSQNDAANAVTIGWDKGYFSLMPGWQIAPDVEGSIEVVKAHCWGADGIALKGTGNSGHAYKTKCVHSPGTPHGYGNALQVKYAAGHKFYKVRHRNTRILIMKPGPDYQSNRRRRRRTTSIEYNGCEYATADQVMPDSTHRTCLWFRTGHTLPGGWEWAPIDNDAIQAASKEHWGADTVVVGSSLASSLGVKTLLYREQWWWQSWIGNHDRFYPGPNFYDIWQFVADILGLGQFYNRYEAPGLPWQNAYKWGYRGGSGKYRPAWCNMRLLIRKRGPKFEAHRRRTSQAQPWTVYHPKPIIFHWWR